MTGGPTTTGSSSSSSILQPWTAAQPGLRQMINVARVGQRRWGHLSGGERAAIGEQKANAKTAKQYMPAQQNLISDLYGGGGFGQGRDYLTNAMEQSQNTLNPYMQSNYLDPMTNPYLQPAIEAARSGAMGSVADRFQAAGRNFSGAEAGAMGREMTNSALPMLLNQYNQNVGAQQNAAGQVMSGGVAGSGALDSISGNELKARMAAPGQIQGLNIPQNMMLAAENYRRQNALNVMNATGNLMGAYGGLGSSGTTTGTSTMQQQSNPWMTGIGAGLGLLGAYGSF